jgi:TonB family protein
MSHTSDIDSRSNPDGLQEIRSWASRSPDAARPEFRTRPRSGGFRLSSRLAASIGLALLLLLVLTGSRFLQNGRDTSDLATVPKPKQAATSAPVPAEEAPPAAEVVADSPPPSPEPVVARTTLAEKPESDERVRPKPAKEPRSSSRSRLVVSPEAFESEPAVLLSAPTAHYPDAARGTGASAEVVVGFTIDETGKVRNPAVESSRIQGDAPKALFEDAALAATRHARFTPARERGEPTRSWSTLTFSFETGEPSAGI